MDTFWIGGSIHYKENSESSSCESYDNDSSVSSDSDDSNDSPKLTSDTGNRIPKQLTKEWFFGGNITSAKHALYAFRKKDKKKISLF